MVPYAISGLDLCLACFLCGTRGDMQMNDSLGVIGRAVSESGSLFLKETKSSSFIFRQLLQEALEMHSKPIAKGGKTCRTQDI